MSVTEELNQLDAKIEDLLLTAFVFERSGAPETASATRKLIEGLIAQREQLVKQTGGT